MLSLRDELLEVARLVQEYLERLPAATGTVAG